MKVISVTKSVENAGCDGINIFQHGSVFCSVNIITGGATNITAGEKSTSAFRVCFNGAGKSEVRKFFQRYLLGMARSADVHDIFLFNRKILFEVFSDEKIFFGDHPLYCREDDFVFEMING